MLSKTAFIWNGKNCNTVNIITIKISCFLFEYVQMYSI